MRVEIPTDIKRLAPVKPGSVFVDSEGDVHLVVKGDDAIDGMAALCFGNASNIRPWVRPFAVNELLDGSTVLPPGTRVTLVAE